ncbi:hypothetical protein BJY52DRAFT_651670 [Lactarius psammicola]|nr:hypothetical protein BJY52DRAFT_651670 [Lactarius psammicola]
MDTRPPSPMLLCHVFFFFNLCIHDRMKGHDMLSHTFNRNYRDTARFLQKKKRSVFSHVCGKAIVCLAVFVLF